MLLGSFSLDSNVVFLADYCMWDPKSFTVFSDGRKACMLDFFLSPYKYDAGIELTHIYIKGFTTRAGTAGSC